MFTGIVEEIVRISGISKTKSGIMLYIKTQNIASGAKLGDSIAVNGVCLTISDIKNGQFSFDVISETLRRTNLGELKINDSVNLERSIKADSRIGGHFVSGHIDYKGKIVELLKNVDGIGFRISLPREFSGFVVEKGSISVDGVSLTVAAVEKEDFIVYLIPHTLKTTTFGSKKKNDSVNIETDLIAKYIAKQNNSNKADFATLLRKYDYI